LIATLPALAVSWLALKASWVPWAESATAPLALLGAGVALGDVVDVDGGVVDGLVELAELLLLLLPQAARTRLVAASKPNPATRHEPRLGIC
jgi:hypothetical protein